MKAASLAAILALALAATGAFAQSPTATTSQSPSATTAQSPSATTAKPGEPQILNAPKPAERPAAAAEPYAGQKPPQQTTATEAPAATPAAPAAEGAATAAKAAATEAKSAAPVPEGPVVKPIGKSETPASTTAEAKPEAKSDPVPTLAKPEPPKPTLRVAIDLTNQKMTVSENGGSQFKWNISSGRTGYLTPKGTFRPVWMSKMWYSKKYDYAPMPHAIFFHGGAAIHGTDSVYALGRPASHGCVRLSPSNAATLYGLVTKHGKQKTQITVFGTPKQQSSPVASNEDGTRRPRTPMRGYDNEPWLNDDDDDDRPPVPRRGVYGDRGYYDDGYERPSRYRVPPRQRRYVRDYDSYDNY